MMDLITRKEGPMIYYSLLISLSLLLVGCHRTTEENNVVTQRYIHKYGYAVSKEEFQDRKYPGQVITTLKNGVTVTATYENGVLHGPTTHTFPHSQTVESYFLYNEGALVKQILYDVSGMPQREEVQLSPTRYASTKWYANGTPLCTEEYAGEELIDGQYFTPQNEVEARIEKGRGNRVVRNSKGLLIAREAIDEGYVTERETFYENGTPETVAYFVRGVLHGEKKSFSEAGEPLAVKEFVNGKLHGKTTFYKNGVRAVEIHYLDGMKNGLEIHWLDGDVISQEILWENDKKHGPSKYYVEGVAQTEYFYDGSAIPETRWNELNHLDEMINRINPAVVR